MLKETEFKITPSDGLGSSASYGGFSFGCAREPKGGKVQLVNAYHSCREGLMGNMRTRITGSNKEQPTDKMRMIFRFSSGSSSGRASELKGFEQWMLRAIPVLQAFDKLAGWPLTRVYKVNTTHDSWLRAYYTHSSRRWMKSSYLVSLYCLLVRMCKDERIKGFKDFNGLVKLLEKINSGGSNIKMDSGYVKNSMPYWESIMKGYGRLFRAKKLPYYWDTSRLSGQSTGGAEGIQYLVSGSTKYTEIREELLKIKAELKKGTFKAAVAKKK